MRRRSNKLCFFFEERVPDDDDVVGVVTGSGDVTYKGSPTVKRILTGNGSVEQAD